MFSKITIGGLMKGVAVAFLVLSCLLGCFGCSEGEPSSNASINAKKVTVETLHVKHIESLERVPGNVHPALSSTLEAKVPGKILKFLVQEGDVIKAHQVLIELDVHEIQARLDQAIAAQKQADKDLKRFSQLLPSGAVTRQEFDSVQARAKIAEAGVAEAQAMMSYATIDAPYDGVVTKKLSQEGDFASPGKPLLMVEKQDQYRFESDIPETISANIKKGDTYTFTLSGLGKDLQGEVVEVSPTTDANSRTLHVKLDMPHDSNFRSGQFGYLFIPVRSKPEIRIPPTSLVERGQLEFVYVVESRIARLRLVRSGKRDSSGIEILSGLHDGETIVTENPSSLSDMDVVEAQDHG